MEEDGLLELHFDLLHVFAASVIYVNIDKDWIAVHYHRLKA